jgi:hypothetical protein
MTNSPPLTLLEEFLLLALNEKTGQLYPLDPAALNRAVAGAVLMDLSLRDRIDNDLRDMFTIDATPTGDDILDPVLQMMSLAPVLTPHCTAHWLRELAMEGESLLKKAVSRLEKRGIIRQSVGMFWMLGLGTHTSVDEQKVHAIKSGLLGIVYGAGIPTTRYIMLTGLADSCGLFKYLMNETEAKDAAARIAEISRMDLIGQAAAKRFPGADKPTLAAASGNH